MGTDALRPEDYIEDGKRLLRVIELDDEGQAIVEDCTTLKIESIQLEEGWRRVERV